MFCNFLSLSILLIYLAFLIPFFLSFPLNSCSFLFSHPQNFYWFSISFESFPSFLQRLKFLHKSLLSSLQWLTSGLNLDLLQKFLYAQEKLPGFIYLWFKCGVIAFQISDSLRSVRDFGEQSFCLLSNAQTTRYINNINIIFIFK